MVSHLKISMQTDRLKEKKCMIVSRDTKKVFAKIEYSLHDLSSTKDKNFLGKLAVEGNFFNLKKVTYKNLQ